MQLAQKREFRDLHGTLHVRERKLPLVIINADDFGSDKAINQGVVKSFKLGYISSTTIMVNMPGFAETCKLAKKENLLSHIGLHLNLTEGKPLTQNIACLSRFCSPNGYFVDPRKGNPFYPLKQNEKQALREEIIAQITACRERGLPLTHIDSHHHVHTLWNIGQVVVQVAREMGINRVRLARNCGPKISLVKRTYKTIYNQWLQVHHMAGVRYFGNIDDFAWLLRDRRLLSDLSAEIMTHPKLGPNGVILDYKSDVLLQEKLDRLPIPFNIITSYSGVSYLRNHNTN